MIQVDDNNSKGTNIAHICHQPAGGWSCGAVQINVREQLDEITCHYGPK